MSLWGWLRSQFATLHYPDEDCTGKAIIVTGANVGLGLEAARHMVRLNAAKVILACRSAGRGEAAKKDIEETTGRTGVVEVWQLDLSSFESVRQFAARVDKLERLDVLLNNASFMSTQWQVVEGREAQLTVNVISTLLLTVMVLPMLRRTAIQFNVTPCATIVASDAGLMAMFPERKADHIIETLATNQNRMERYNTSKLLQIMMMKKLAASVDASGKGHVTVNALNPGFCKTQLYRQWGFPLDTLVNVALAVLGRDAETGSRTLVAAALQGDETHGQYLNDYAQPHVWPKYMKGGDGEKLTQKVWDELLASLQEIEPGVTANI